MELQNNTTTYYRNLNGNKYKLVKKTRSEHNYYLTLFKENTLAQDGWEQISQKSKNGTQTKNRIYKSFSDGCFDLIQRTNNKYEILIRRLGMFVDLSFDKTLNMLTEKLPNISFNEIAINEGCNPMQYPLYKRITSIVKQITKIK